ALDSMAGRLAYDIQFALEGVRHHDVGAAANEKLPDDRLNGLDGRRHGHVGVYRYVSPAQHDLAFVAHGAFEFLFASQARCCFLGKKDHRHTVFVWWRKLYALRGHVLAIQGIGYLDENTRAVSHEDRKSTRLNSSHVKISY